jgi:hypothetical protein
MNHYTHLYQSHGNIEMQKSYAIQKKFLQKKVQLMGLITKP